MIRFGSDNYDLGWCSMIVFLVITSFILVLLIVSDEGSTQPNICCAILGPRECRYGCNCCSVVGTRWSRGIKAV